MLAAKSSGADHEPPAERANAHADGSGELAPERAPRVRVVARAVDDGEARGPDEHVDGPRREDLGRDARGAVARELRTQARREPGARADRERQRRVALADDVDVGREPHVAERGGVRRRERDAVDHRALSVLVERDRSVQRDANPREGASSTDHQRAAEVNERLMADERISLFARRVVDDERLVRVVEGRARRRALRAQIERVHHEVLAPALGGLEPVDREARARLRARRRRHHEERERGRRLRDRPRAHPSPPRSHDAESPP